MNKDVLESQWVQIRNILKEKFSNLTDEDIRQINGRYDQLVAKIEQRYGYSREEAEERIRSWNFDRFATPRTNVVREETVLKESDDTGSLYKWLLCLGLPLLLLGLYFLSNRAPEATHTPVVTHEQVMTESPADRVISTNLHNAYLALQQQNSSFAIQNVQITTHDGVVTLSGTVPNAEIRDSIVNATQHFAGVRQVVNHIEVK